jgi:hypothetical protein
MGLPPERGHQVGLRVEIHLAQHLLLGFHYCALCCPEILDSICF